MDFLLDVESRSLEMAIWTETGHFQNEDGPARKCEICNQYPVGTRWTLYAHAERGIPATFVLTYVKHDPATGLPTLGMRKSCGASEMEVGKTTNF